MNIGKQDIMFARAIWPTHLRHCRRYEGMALYHGALHLRADLHWRAKEGRSQVHDAILLQ